MAPPLRNAGGAIWGSGGPQPPPVRAGKCSKQLGACRKVLQTLWGLQEPIEPSWGVGKKDALG
eukprot:12169566-Alexandrium_andersonii.AAC.1